MLREGRGSVYATPCLNWLGRMWYNVLMYDAQNLSPLQAFLRSKWVRVVLVVDVLLVLLLIGVAIFQNTKTATVDILTVPSVAKVKIGGGEYESGAYRIHPGDYEATVYADGFVTKTVPVEARAGEISKVWVYLVPEEGGFDWYTLKDNYDEFEQLAKIASTDGNATTYQDANAEEFVERFQENYEIYKENLPIDVFEYQENNTEQLTQRYATIRDFIIEINNDSDCNKTICIKVLVNKLDDKDYVQRLLIDKGFNMNWVEVRYDSV